MNWESKFLKIPPSGHEIFCPYIFCTWQQIKRNLQISKWYT